MVAVFVFRFTPGVRFPGPLVCGIMKLPVWKFLTVGFMAALISVPTQIYLVAIYGEPILKFLHEVKMVLLAFACVGLLVFFFRKFYLRSKQV